MMSRVRTSPPRFAHDALLFRSDHEFLAATVPFLRDGIDAGEVVVTDLSDRRWELVAAALEDDVQLLVRPPMTDRRPAHAIPAAQRFVEDQLSAGAERLRGIGEMRLPREPVLRAEWRRGEAALNQVLARYPVWLVCAFDARSLPENVLGTAQEVHAHLLGGTGRRPSRGYREPGELLREVAPDPLEETPPALEVDRLTDLSALRHDVELCALEAALPGNVAVDYATAVVEVGNNALRHGRPPACVRLWVTPRRLLCTVTDRGTGIGDPFAGYRDPACATTADGLGLWRARQLCDQLVYAQSADGFTVRLVLTARRGDQLE
jgi:anti-sigma regulatory factor (Ser/Thr protein kinase)